MPVQPGGGASDSGQVNAQLQAQTPSLSAPKVVIALLATLALVLLLADHYPRIAIGFMLLVLVGVVLSHAGIIKSALSF